MRAFLAGPAVVLLLVLPWIQPLSTGPSRNAWPWLLSMACLGVLLLLHRYWRAERLAQATLLAALISCVIALVQYLGWASYASPWLTTMGPGEGAGNLRQRNQLASLTALGLVSLAYLQTKQAGQSRRLGLAATGVALVLLGAGHAATSSRTGLLAWALVLAAGAGWYWRRQRAIVWLLGLGVAMYLLASLSLPLLLQWVLDLRGLSPPCVSACDALSRLMTSDHDSRLTLWRNVGALIVQQPWTGWGWNELDYAHYITLFDEPRFMEKLGNAHNLPLHLAVELGLPLALASIAALAAGLWQARPWRQAPDWLVAAWAALGILALHSLLEYPLWYGPFQITALWVAIGLWQGARLRKNPTLRPEPSIDDKWLKATALCVLVAVAWVAFDYHRVSQIYLPAEKRHPAYRHDPLEHAQSSWFFKSHAQFAQLALTPLSAENAAEHLQLAERLLHHSPEPLVIERLLDSAQKLGRQDLLTFHAARYEAAYPVAYSHWRKRQAYPNTPK